MSLFRNSMKLSLQTLWQNVLKTAERFPIVVADVVIVTLLATHDWEYAKSAVYLKLLLTTILGFPLLLSISLFAERQNVDAKTRAVVPLLGLIPLTVYFITLSSPSSLGDSIRFSILCTSFIFLLSFAPYINKGEVNGFWRYNKSLVFGFAVSGLSAIVFMGGISIALIGCDYLLGLHMPGWVYQKLWLINVCLIWPVIFLATLSESFGQLETSDQFDKLSESFVRYIIIPLVLLYMIILYLYAGKIIIQTTWPKGGVAGFILGFSCLGLLSVLLIHPLRTVEGNRWIGTYLKWLCISILPQTIMLFLAVWRRVSEYGVTESRYFGILAAIWLAGICIYFLFSKSKSIIVVSISLFIVAFLSSFGPWGALSVSEQSQIRQLKNLLEKNNILVNGKIIKTTTPISKKEQGAISLIVKYLYDRHNVEPFKGWFEENLPTTKADEYPRKIVTLMGLSYTPYHRETGKNIAEKHYYFSAARSGFVKITGYDYYGRIGFYSDEDSCGDDSSHSSSVAIDGMNYRASFDAKFGKLLINRDHQVVMSLDIQPIARKLRQKYNDASEAYNKIPRKDMVVEGSAGNLSVKVFFSTLSFKENKNALEFNSATGDVFLKKAGQ